MKSDLLSNRYMGSTAEQYDKRRSWSEKWKREQETVEVLLGRLPAGSLVLDVPVGTGRFLQICQAQGLVGTGIDMSNDMLRECDTKAREHGYEICLVRGNALALGVKTDSHDVVVCMRFLNWFRYDEVNAVIAELSRVSRGQLIVGLRHLVPFRQLGFARVLGRLLMHLRGRRAKQGLVYHKEKQIHSLFRGNGLAVEERHLIERRRDGTDYFLYALEVNAETQSGSTGGTD